MPNIKSAKKRVVVNQKKTEQNKSIRSALRTDIKKIELLIKEGKVAVTVFLINGVKWQGVITWFDEDSILLRRDGHTQLIYKHAVSTIMPSAAIDISGDE